MLPLLALCLADTTAIAQDLGTGSTLFEDWAHDDFSFGMYRSAATRGPDVPWTDFTSAISGFDLLYRDVKPIRFRSLGTGNHYRVRASRDLEGRVLLDEVTLAIPWSEIHVEPAAGDRLRLSLLGGAWDLEVWRTTTETAQVRAFLPVRATPFGLSDTDQDEDTRLKIFVAGGAGLGADALVKAVRQMGLQVRAEGGAQTARRFRVGAPDGVRHEVWSRGEVGFAVFEARSAWIVGGWFEHRAQWETRSPPCGIDRQITTFGMRVSTRRYPEPELGILGVLGAGDPGTWGESSRGWDEYGFEGGLGTWEDGYGGLGVLGTGDVYGEDEKPKRTSKRTQRRYERHDARNRDRSHETPAEEGQIPEAGTVPDDETLHERNDGNTKTIEAGTPTVEEPASPGHGEDPETPAEPDAPEEPDAPAEPDDPPAEPAAPAGGEGGGD